MLAGCVTSQPKQTQAELQNDVFEIFFTTLIGSNGSANMSRQSAIALCFPKHSDPDPEFLKRFSNQSTPIVPCSAGARGPAPAYEAILRTSGAPAIQLSIDAVYFSSDSEVAIEGGYYEASLSGAGWRFELEKKHGKWVIVKHYMMGVS